MAIETRGFLRLVKTQADLVAEPVLLSFLPGNAGTPFTQRSARLPDSQVKVIRAHLDTVLRSKHFDGSARSREFLRYVVEEVLAGRGAYLKQAAIAVEVFGRKIQPGQLIHADKHGFLAIPPGEEEGLLDAARFMDSNECNTVIPAARYSYGKPLQQISDDFGVGVAKFSEAVKEKFKRQGEW